MPENINTIKAIIRKCLEIDVMAVKVYQRFADLPTSRPARMLFQTLHDDETRHVAYWSGLLNLADEGGIGEIFEDSEKLLYELTAVADQALAVEKEALAGSPDDVNGLLLRVIKMEYVLLHPSFLALFNVAKILPGHRTMEDEYVDHIEHLCTALNTHSAENPMFSLFSELLRRIWEETRRLVSQNQSDGLSGVLNRRGFHAQIRPLLHLARRKQYTVALMFVDIDYFKRINDDFGHQAGDRIIRLVADAIRNSVRQSDVVARYGGDEFVAFLPDVETGALEAMARKIKAGIEAQSTSVAPATVSIGIAAWNLRAESEQVLERLLKEADAALYEVKQAGRNSFRLRLLS